MVSIMELLVNKNSKQQVESFNYGGVKSPKDG